jgi:hypothetical protein
LIAFGCFGAMSSRSVGECFAMVLAAMRGPPAWHAIWEGGWVLYVLHPDRPATTDSLVNIFDEAPAELVGTLQEQRIFFESWFEGKKG